MNRIFQVLRYTKLQVQYDLTPQPTYVMGATAHSAAQPLCTLYGVHFSDIELKELSPGEPLTDGGRIVRWDKHCVVMIGLDELDRSAATREQTSEDTERQAQASLNKLHPRKAKGKR